MLNSIDISTSGLVAQRHRLNTIAENLANINTTRDENGNIAPFQRRLVRFQQQEQSSQEAGRGAGVQFQVEVDQQSEPRKVYQPGHPDADDDGYVSFPNINVVTEMVNAMEASRAYEANIVSINMTKEMGRNSLSILQ